MYFASDNASGAAPEIVAAVARANAGYVDSYGADAAMARVTARLRALFEAPEAAVHLVATGTAANALALACLCPPWASVCCHAEAHVNVDECGAPEFYSGGAKLVGLPGDHGRIEPAALDRALAGAVETGVHSVQRGALSLTNATEAGTVYDPGAVARLAASARGYGLPVHMDGARFANAVVRLGCTPAEATWKAGVDALSFGGTKNGCLGVEAVILFDPARSWEFELRRKRGGHLFSKHRFLSAQMEAYLADDLWLTLAGRANDRAAELARGLAALPGARLLHPVEANAVFAALPRAAHRAALAAGARYYLWPGSQSLDGPDSEPLGARFVCSWSTTAEEIADLVGALAGASVGTGVGAEGWTGEKHGRTTDRQDGETGLAELDGKVALVTGAGMGIGAATARALARAGARVLVAEIDAAAGEETAAAIAAEGGEARFVATDVRALADAEWATATAIAAWGRLDILVNNAGRGIRGVVDAIDEAGWNEVISTNLTSVWRFMKCAVPQMRAQGGGSIVNVSSVQSLRGFHGWAAYAAAKGGIDALTRQAAVDLAADGIRVNAVAPGTIMTPLNEKVFREAADPQALIAAWNAAHPLGRFGQPEEVAEAIVFLAGGRASFVTGDVVRVDGGLAIRGD